MGEGWRGGGGAGGSATLPRTGVMSRELNRLYGLAPVATNKHVPNTTRAFQINEGEEEKNASGAARDCMWEPAAAAAHHARA